MFSDAMIEKILTAKAPKTTMRDGEYILDLDGDLYDLTLEQADLLFRSMFFRGHNY